MSFARWWARRVVLYRLRRHIAAERAFVRAEARLASLERLAVLEDELSAKDRRGRRRVLRLAQRKGIA